MFYNLQIYDIFNSGFFLFYLTDIKLFLSVLLYDLAGDKNAKIFYK